MAIYKIDGVDGDFHFPKKFVTMNITLAASGSISAGEWVAIDLDLSAAGGLGANVEESTTSLPQLVFGVAAESITNSSSTDTLATTIKVQTAGKAENCAVESTVAAGDFLVASTATAGRAVEVDSGTAVAGTSASDIQNALKLARVGVALEAASSNLADCMIIDQGYF